MHIIHADIRTNTFFLSKLQRERDAIVNTDALVNGDAPVIQDALTGKVDYWLVHNGAVPIKISEDFNIAPIVESSYHVTRYGPKGLTSYDKNILALFFGVRRGQYENDVESGIASTWQVSPELLDFSIAVSNDREVLLSGRDLEGDVFNYHSGDRLNEIASRASINLLGSTLTPIRLR